MTNPSTATMIDSWSLLDFSEFNRLKTLCFDFDPYHAGIDHFRVISAILQQISSTSLCSLTVYCTANLFDHHKDALVVLQNCISTLNDARFASMHHPLTFHAKTTRQVISQAQIYCDSIGDLGDRWIRWLMDSLCDPQHVLEISPPHERVWLV
jgi:hypothetical protein